MKNLMLLFKPDGTQIVSVDPGAGHFFKNTECIAILFTEDPSFYRKIAEPTVVSKIVLITSADIDSDVVREQDVVIKT